MIGEVFIFGTSHSLQCGKPEGRPGVSRMEAEIRRIIAKFGIRRIAEEMSCDGLRESGTHETVCQRLAGEDLPVQFVDLDRAERTKLAISDSQIVGFVLGLLHSGNEGEEARVREALTDQLCHEVRERVCVARVLTGYEWPVLYVCGADHAVPVRRLLAGIGVRARIVHRDFDPDE
ncbi:MAG: hypothetical protein OXM56_08645 [Gammaproteobacteria bacterium]|nr:hypothetical protein [Gammaproteobacteria bacterium]